MVGSDYFASMFNINHKFIENKEGISEVPLEADIYEDITADIVECVLHYIYHGVLPKVVSKQTIPDIYRLSDIWQLESLAKLCRKIIMKNVDETSFLYLLNFSKFYSDKSLHASLCSYAVIHLNKIVNTKDFTDILGDDFFDIINRPLFLCYEVSDWIYVIKKWANGSRLRFMWAFQSLQPRKYSEEETLMIMQELEFEGWSTQHIGILETWPDNKLFDPKVRYFPTSNIDLCDNVDQKGNFSAGLMVHNRERIKTEIVEINIDSFLEILPGIDNCVRIRNQIVHGTDIYFLLSDACNWNTEVGCDMSASSIFIYSFISKTWRRKMVILQNIPSLSTNVSCINCSGINMMRLHVQKDVLFLLLVKFNDLIVIKTDLTGSSEDWTLHSKMPLNDRFGYDKTVVLTITEDRIWLMEERGGSVGGIRVIEMKPESHIIEIEEIEEVGSIVNYEGQNYQGHGEFNWYMKAVVDSVETPHCVYTAKGNVDDTEQICLGKYIIGGNEQHRIFERRNTSFCKIRNLRMDDGVIHIFAEREDFRGAYLTF